jgi:MerR HTH family regulatory protein
MPRKIFSDPMDALMGDRYETPRFSTGEAAEVLKMPIWRLQKFLDLKSYPLWPTAQLGRGKGKRRMFSKEDLYRVAIADFLLKDGFTPKVVAEVLQMIEDRNFINYDEKGEATLGFYILRESVTRTRSFRLFRPDRSRPPKDAYYALDFGLPMGEVETGIREAIEKRKEGN